MYDRGFPSLSLRRQSISSVPGSPTTIAQLSTILSPLHHPSSPAIATPLRRPALQQSSLSCATSALQRPTTVALQRHPGSPATLHPLRRPGSPAICRPATQGGAHHFSPAPPGLFGGAPSPASPSTSTHDQRMWVTHLRRCQRLRHWLHLAIQGRP